MMGIPPEPPAPEVSNPPLLETLVEVAKKNTSKTLYSAVMDCLDYGLTPDQIHNTVKQAIKDFRTQD